MDLKFHEKSTENREDQSSRQVFLNKTRESMRALGYWQARIGVGGKPLGKVILPWCVLNTPRPLEATKRNAHRAGIELLYQESGTRYIATVYN